MKKKNKIIIFFKYVGAGNDFLIIDLRSQKIKLSKNIRKKLVIKYSNRHQGIGADGVIFLEKPKNKANQFYWDFYNDDGSYAEMCLNAARCVSFYEIKRTGKKRISFETDIGVLFGTRQSKEKILIEMPIQRKTPEKKQIRVCGQNISGYFINSGTPQFLIRTQKINPKKEVTKARQIRNHKIFGPRGTNVTYWSQALKNQKTAVTYERGVEDFTLACGTGAAAVALLADHLFAQTKVFVQMPGGRLTIKIFKNRLQMTGPVQKICSGYIEQEKEA